MDRSRGQRGSGAPNGTLKTWALATTTATAVVWFAHECAHGLGYRLDGASVSTGFNMVGSPGKVPGDAGFRAAVPVTGTPNLGTFLGPLTNWIVAGVATAAFLRWPKGRRGLILAATAVGAALPRVLSVASFLGGAAAGRAVYQDEVEWGASHVRGLRLPTTLDRFETMIRSHPREILTTPAIYVWPALSILVCGSCLLIVYVHLRRNHAAPFGRRWPAAMAVPIGAWAVVGLMFAALDRVVRINW